MVTDTPVSSYLLLTVSCLALYMVASKRLMELRFNGVDSRPILSKYSLEWLEKISAISVTLSFVFYSMWALEYFAVNYVMYIVIGALLLYLLYSYDMDRFQEGDPMSLVFKDNILLLIGIVYFVGISLLFIKKG